ncbi:hypothetical protein DHEL01_v210997 [Diaporthe helianthi]|uniref:Uncharacterized protein n=1 Tax=Diaporthe helianthi TaxID=158607 RepID=A0A2P5HK37_DIAHE|nr:hypothetical protein DHEL01_v210997 [Diaporthe helianthi]
MQAPEINSATIEGWYEDFHEMKVAEWQQTVAEFNLEWKRWCFAQRRASFWQDSLITDATKHIWTPLSDFNYVLSVYSFLEGVNNPNLLPHLRPVYMAWRSPEQIRLHERCGLGLGGQDNLPSENGASSNHPSRRDNGSRAAASKYPLTRRQHLRLARTCDDVDWMLRHLRHCLQVFQNCRLVCAAASTAAATFSDVVVVEHRRGLGNAARQFHAVSKTLISHLRVSRTGLCEALGLDPDKVPGGDIASTPTMTVANNQRNADTHPSHHGGPALPRSFCLKRASLQARRIALKAALCNHLLPGKTAQRILGRMMNQSTEMATMARKAHDQKAEATMRRLHNKLRKVHKRAGQEFPDMKPKMTLLDSVTWEAVLNPREDMQLEIHGDISMPVETLIDLLHAPQVPASTPACNPEPTPAGISDPPSVASVSTALEDSSSAEQTVNKPTSTISSPPEAVQEAEARST